MRALGCVFFVLLFACGAHAQSPKDFLARVRAIKALLSSADTLRPFGDVGVSGKIETTNKKIYRGLKRILTLPTSIRFNLDSLLHHPFLGIVHSPDKRLWIFGWYENTGGSFKSNLNLVHYRTTTGRLKVVENKSPSSNAEETGANTGFYDEGASFSKIYKLKAKGKNLYLCRGGGVGCNTCGYEIASVVELTKTGINFQYPAFPETSERSNKTRTPCFVLTARLGDIERFEFDAHTQTIHYAYKTDDMTPVRSEDQIGIGGRFVFDGKRFRQYERAPK